MLVPGSLVSNDGEEKASSKYSMIDDESEIILLSIDKHGTVAVGENAP
jgi:hypothetical protein